MSIYQRTLAGECEMTTGVFTPATVMPVFTGDNNAAQLAVTFKNGGAAYNIPSGVTVLAHLYYASKPVMTVSVAMTVATNVATCLIPESFTALSGSPQMVIRMTDAVGGDTVACAFTVNVKAAVSENAIYLTPPSPDAIVYVGRAPYIGENDNWYEWDEATQAYVDTGVSATIAYASDIPTDTTDVSVQDALDAHTSQLADIVTDTVFPATNLMSNGNFDSTDEWIFELSTGSVAGGKASFTATSQCGRIKQNFPMIAVHKYYCRGFVKTDSANVKVTIGDDTYFTDYFITHSGSGNVEPFSLVESMPATINAATAYVAVVDMRASGWTPVEAQYFLYVDLTTSFGAGNEPTAAQMDAMLARFPYLWFDGTANLFNGEATVREMLRLESAKADKVQEDWITPTLINGWINDNDAVFNSLQYFRDTIGIVHLKGVVKSGTVGVAIMQLPSGYRPVRENQFIVYSDPGVGLVGIQVSGNVCLWSGATTHVVLDGLSFRADQ